MIDKELRKEDYSFTITNDDGVEMICDTLAIIEKDGEPIIIYTDYTLDKNEKFNLFVSKVVSDGEAFVLSQIDDYSDIPEIQKAITTIYNGENI